MPHHNDLCIPSYQVRPGTPSAHETRTLLTLPETTIDTLLDLREDGGELGDVLCAGLDEIMRFLIDDSIDDLSDKPYLQRLQTLMMIRELIQKLTHI